MNNHIIVTKYNKHVFFLKYKFKIQILMVFRIKLPNINYNNACKM